jgi:hypothetical protein
LPQFLEVLFTGPDSLLFSVFDAYAPDCGVLAGGVSALPSFDPRPDMMDLDRRQRCAIGIILTENEERAPIGMAAILAGLVIGAGG